MVKLRGHERLIHGCVKLLFGLGWSDVADRLKDAAIVKPVDPFEGGIFHGIKRTPWPTPVDHFGLEQAGDGLGQSEPRIGGCPEG